MSKKRIIPRLNWEISEIGYGMWGIGGGEGGWKGNDDDESMLALQRAIDKGCNFFDTAWIYGRGHSEKIMGEVLRNNINKKLYVASKIPPKNRIWPSSREMKIEDVFPDDHIHEYIEKSLENLGTSSIDIMQFHVWEDSWWKNDSWKKIMLDYKQQGIIRAIGISINRWEPWNVLETLKTDLIDTVQVCYNIFDQSPDDELIPYCEKNGIGIIARVPFDEGILSGAISRDTKFDQDDWRSSYFVEENLLPSMDKVDEIKKLVPFGYTLAQLALKFILSNPQITTVIPGMRKIRHVDLNFETPNLPELNVELINKLKLFRWDRTPTTWSQ